MAKQGYFGMNWKNTLGAVSLLALFACADNDINITEFKATIVEGIHHGVDCEYVIEPNTGGFVVSTFLPIQYKEDGLEVFIKAELLEEASDCTNLMGDGRLIRIEQISPAN